MATTLSLLRFAPLPPRLTRSSLTINRTTSVFRSLRVRRVPPISASFTPVPAVDRLVSFLSYARLFLNSLPLSFVLHTSQYALQAPPTSPFSALHMAYKCVPCLDFIGFIVLYFYLARHPAMSHHVRANVWQSLGLDLILTCLDLMLMPVPFLFGTSPGCFGVPVLELGYGAIFVVSIVVSVYGMICSLGGHEPYFPLISSWANKRM